jgi:hypothetical protein
MIDLIGVVRAIFAVTSPSLLVSGTFTTSSATVPADTGRLEANDYWRVRFKVGL